MSQNGAKEGNSHKMNHHNRAFGKCRWRQQANANCRPGEADPDKKITTMAN